MADNNKYTCNEYRQEMILLGLRKRLASPDLSEEEKKRLKEEIAEVEQAMEID
jgi:hypothetical protein